MPISPARATLAIGVVERRGLLALAGLRVGQKHGVVIANDRDLVLEPHTRDERRAWRVLLHGRLVEVQVPDAITSLDLVDGTGAVLEQAVGLRPDAVEVLA